MQSGMSSKHSSFNNVRNASLVSGCGAIRKRHVGLVMSDDLALKSYTPIIEKYLGKLILKNNQCDDVSDCTHFQESCFDAL